MKSWLTSNRSKITRVLFGRSNVFMISNEKLKLLIDTGSKGDGKRLLKHLAQAGSPDAVILTHTHFDHAGNAGLLKERFSPVFLVNEKEKDYFESGDSPLPRGTRPWTRFLYNLGAEKKQHWFHVCGVNANIVFEERFDLKDFGFNGFILHTPGHSDGSCSVIIDNEIALTGDTLVGFIPGSAFPPWGNNAEEIIRSWKKLLDTGCYTFLPAHGFIVSRKRLESEYRRRSR